MRNERIEKREVPSKVCVIRVVGVCLVMGGSDLVIRVVSVYPALEGS